MHVHRFLDTQVARARKLAGIAAVPAYRRALRAQRVAAGVEHERVPFIDAAAVIDVGANRGQFALVARRRFPAATIVAFEPLPAAADALARLFAGDPAFRLHRAAAGARAEERPLHVARADDSSSLLAPTALQTREYPGTDAVTRIVVPVVRLDAAIAVGELARPCLLKIDVQGGELDVLLGAEQLLVAVDQVYVECSFAELYAGQPLAPAVITHLAGAGFRLAGVYHASYGLEGRCLQADLLFDR